MHAIIFGIWVFISLTSEFPQWAGIILNFSSKWIVEPDQHHDPSQQICHHSLKPASQILQITSNFQLHRVGWGSWLEASPLLSSVSCRRLPALLLACPMPAAQREAISFVNSTHSPWQLLTIGPASPDWNKWPFSQYHPNPNLAAAKCLKLPNPI